VLSLCILTTFAVFTLKGSGRDVNGSLGIAASSILMEWTVWMRQQMVMNKKLQTHMMLELRRSSLSEVFCFEYHGDIDDSHRQMCATDVQ
jgi:hypothetical protein